MLKTIVIYWNTLKYLKTSQIFYKIFYYLHRPRIKISDVGDINHPTGIWKTPISKKDSIITDTRFRFLNRELQLDLPEDWSKKNGSLLWMYNLHYFDGILSDKGADNQIMNLELMHSWIKHNIPGSKVSWDPYPTSLRLVNWIKWLINTNLNDEIIINSIYIQSRSLFNRIEYHLSANHLLSNAKALIFSGLFFEGKEAEKWLEKGVKIYNKEVIEQILDDGGHYERSPMYHAIILEDILDILNASNYWNGCIDQSVLDTLREKVKKMIIWLSYMVHPDGEVSFFNDSSFNIAPNIDDLIAYSRSLNIETNSLESFKHFKKSGYVVSKKQDSHIILDIGPVGPDHQSGHGHADTLSFELSLFNERLIVNTGVSTYDICSRRDFERSTKAHNTVEINNTNSSQTWKSFRMGNRADVTILEILIGKKNLITANHNGYAYIDGSPEHTREWIIEEKRILIIDTVTGNYNDAISRLYLHPDIIIENNNFLILPSGKSCKFSTSCKNLKKIRSSWSPEFGIKKANYCFEMDFSEKRIESAISWI